MHRNVGTIDRWLRVVGALVMLALALLAPLPLTLRLPIFGMMGGYLLWTALAGSCLGYRLMGRSTCPSDARR